MTQRDTSLPVVCYAPVVGIKLLQPEARLPERATAGAACIDLHAVSCYDRGVYIEYGTGIALEIPAGYVGLLFPRSSISNTGQHLANSVGVIDSDYRGEVKVRMYRTGSFLRRYDIGQRCAQLMVLPVPALQFQQVHELSSTERGEGGFGSTNK